MDREFLLLARDLVAPAWILALMAALVLAPPTVTVTGIVLTIAVLVIGWALTGPDATFS